MSPSNIGSNFLGISSVVNSNQPRDRTINVDWVFEIYLYEAVDCCPVAVLGARCKAVHATDYSNRECLGKEST